MRTRAAVAFALAALFAGCSLGLDPSKADAPVDDGGIPPGQDGAPPPDVAFPDGVAPPDSSVDAGPGCNVDGDCVAPNACLTPRCDTSRHLCVYDVCKQAQACSRAACNVATHTCGAPATVPYQVGSFKVAPGPVGCGGVPGRCLAAVAPFVFVGTANGVFAYSTANPANPAPAAIPVSGLPFAPASIVASGARVYFVGGVLGGGRIQIAWLDVPADPFATLLAAHSVLVTSQLGSVTSLFSAAPLAGAYVTQNDPAKLYPTALLGSPLNLATVNALPNTGAAANVTPVATSGSRMILYRFTQQGAQVSPLFSLVTGTGSATAATGAEQNLAADEGPVWGQPAMVQFAQGANGGLLWGVPFVQIGSPPAGVKGARVTWLLADDKDPVLQAKLHVDVETSDPGYVPIDQPVSGPIAWLDPDNALVLAEAPANLSTTSVQVASKAGGTASVVPSKRVVLPIAAGKSGVAAAGGYAYVLAADAADSATAYVFAPSCN